MTNQTIIIAKQGRAMGYALLYLLLMPVCAGMALFGGVLLANTKPFAGVFWLLLGAFCVMLCLSQIYRCMRAAKPFSDMLVMTPKTLFDSRIMKHPVEWSRLNWQLCSLTGRVFLEVDARSQGHMHRRVADQFLAACFRLSGRYSYVVSDAFTGLPKGVVAYEMGMHRRPTGNHSHRRAPAE